MLCLVFLLQVTAELKGHKRARAVSMAACTVLTSRSWYLTEPVELGFTLQCMTEAGGFISSWRREPVNVLELPASFESVLIHFGCKPSATVLLVFSQAWEENSCIFSAVLPNNSPRYNNISSEGFFEIIPQRNAGIKKTHLRMDFGNVSFADFFVFFASSS